MAIATKEGTVAKETADTGKPDSAGTATGGGMFDGLGAAPEAEKDASKVPSAEGEVEGTPEKEPVEAEVVEKEAKEVEREEETEETEEVAGEPIEVMGRTFKSPQELATAYEESSDEGIRLNNECSSLKAELIEERKQRMALEDVLGEQGYGETLSDEAFAELSALKQQEYIAKKMKWEDQRESSKKERESARKEMEGYDEEVKRIIQETEYKMASNPKAYPLFKELETTRKDVIKMTPCIANRPETPIIAQYIALGIEYKGILNAGKNKTEEERKKAALQSEAAGVQSGKPLDRAGNRGKKLSEGDQETNRTVAAWHRRSL